MIVVVKHFHAQLLWTPEKREELPSAARRPGQINAVVAPIGGHHEAAPAAGVSHAVVVNSKTEWKETYF